MKLLKVYIVCASQIEIGISISFSQDSKHCVFQLNSNNNNTTPHTTFLTQVFKNSIFFLKQSPTIVDFITLTKKNKYARQPFRLAILLLYNHHTHTHSHVYQKDTIKNDLELCDTRHVIPHNG